MKDELILVPRPVLQEAVDQLNYLAGVLEWKRGDKHGKTEKQENLEILINKLTLSLCREG